MTALPRTRSLSRRLGAITAACFLAVCGAALSFVGPAAATSIAILVNDDPITEYDIAQRQKLISATSGGAAGNAKQKAIDELIDEKLKLQEARRLGVSAVSLQVDQAFESIATRVKLSPSQFAQALQQIGVNPETLKKRLEADLLWREVVRARFRTNVNIRDRDIEAALARKGEELPQKSIELGLQQIILIIPQGSSADYARQRKADAQSFMAKYTGCDSARDLAKSYRDIVVKETVRRNLIDLGPDAGSKLKDTQVGGIVGPSEGPSAIELIGVCDREEVEDQTAARKQVQSELMNEQGDRLSRRLLIDLKQSAVIEYR